MRKSSLLEPKEFGLSDVLPFSIIALHIFLKPSTSDEGEHLHFSYLVGHGWRPYRDFFEHHMPLVWYVFSPIVLFDSFLSKIVFYKSMQVLIVGLNILLLSRSFPGSKGWSAWAFLIFMMLSAPFLDYFDLRPEFIGMPLVTLATTHILRKPELNAGNATAIGFLCGMNLFVTPRLYPFVFVLGVLILFGRSQLRQKFLFLASGLIATVLLLYFFGFEDLHFFVFGISGGMGSVPFQKLHYPSNFVNLGIVVFFMILLLQVYRFKRSGFLFLSLNLLIALLWYLEKAPYPVQSTIYFALANFIFVYHFFMVNVRSRPFRLSVFAIFVSASALMAYRFNIYKGLNFFKTEPIYVSMLEKCEDKTIQTRSIGAIIRPLPPGQIFHPLFKEDYTYFGYFQFGILESNFEKIIKHNRSRNVRYIDTVAPCFIDSNVASLLQKVIPEPKHIHRVHAIGNSQETPMN